VRFWDTSAVVPLILNQPASENVAPLLASDGQVVVWWGTPVECASAVARLERSGEIDTQGASTAFRALALLRDGWSEVEPTDAVRARAVRLLRGHPLRAADALQLAAALVWSGDAPGGLEMVALDRQLRAIGAREGFTLLP
jgi:predicted nucleic acid-binding protein